MPTYAYLFYGTNRTNWKIIKLYPGITHISKFAKRAQIMKQNILTWALPLPTNVHIWANPYLYGRTLQKTELSSADHLHASLVENHLWKHPGPPTITLVIKLILDGILSQWEARLSQTLNKMMTTITMTRKNMMMLQLMACVCESSMTYIYHWGCLWG